MRLTFAGAALAASLVAAGCGGERINRTATFEAPGLPRVAVSMQLRPENRSLSPRIETAALMALKVLGESFGAYPADRITLIDWPYLGGPADPTHPPIGLDRVRWWTAAAAMAPEIATASGISSRYWSQQLPGPSLPRWFVAGLAEYTTRRIVQPIFARDNNAPGFAMAEARDFGGFVPRLLRIRLLPEADGDPLPAYRARPRVEVAGVHNEEETRSLTAKTVLTLASLERWLGRPAFDHALAQFVAESRATGEAPTLHGLIRIASDAAAQDLTWLLVQSLGSAAIFDYGVELLTSAPDANGRFQTRVVVARYGDGMFTGASAPRVGEFESGRGVSIAVTFEDGESILEHWDGRDERRTFEYSSAARALSAEVDPDRAIALDVNRTNNGRSLAPRGGVAATRWSARWLVWLEHLLLDYGFLV